MCGKRCIWQMLSCRDWGNQCMSKSIPIRRQILKYIFNEIRMLTQLSHKNVPWLYSVCYDIKHPRAIAMSYHPFCGANESTTVHTALKENKFHEKIKPIYWKTILMGGTAALDYLFHRKILHNDIKGDNVVIEYLPVITNHADRY